MTLHHLKPAKPERAARNVRSAGTWRTALLSLVAVAAFLPFVTPVGAADLPARQTAPVTPSFVAQDYFFNEVRIGGYYHGIGNPERDTADVNIEVLTRKVWIPSDPDYAWLAPRLHAGGTINTSNHGTNYGYAGLTWTWDDLLFKRTFAEFSFGGAFHDGYTGLYAPFDRAKLGCVALFRESGSLGYRFDDHWSVMATIEHISNGGLCDENRGITSAGLRLGYSF
jgi:lipid A 3-O-deacylase